MVKHQLTFIGVEEYQMIDKPSLDCFEEYWYFKLPINSRLVQVFVA